MKKQLLFLLILLLTIGCAEYPPDIDIWKAAAEGNITAIQQHIKAGTDINGLEPAGGSTPLMVAAMYGQQDAADILISNGAKLEAKNAHGSTALHMAAFFCYPGIVKSLLEKGADPNLKDENGATPLDTVGHEWSKEMAGIYAYVDSMTQMTTDLDRIQRTRDSVAKILKESGAKFANE